MKVVCTDTIKQTIVKTTVVKRELGIVGYLKICNKMGNFKGATKKI